MIFLECFLETIFALLTTEVFIYFLACILFVFSFAGFMMLVHIICTATGGDND